MHEHDEKTCTCHHVHHKPDTSEIKSGELDPGSKSLADALRVSFNLLKLIIAVLVVVFIASAFFTVNADEQAIVLRLGKIRGVGEQRILGPGWHLALVPFDQVIKMPVGKVQAMNIDSFWYYQTDEEKMGQKGMAGPTLNPIRDGYCLTRNDGTTGQSNTDYNIIHAKYRLTYKIADAERFFKNVWVSTPPRGQTYGDVLNESVSPLLQNLTSDAVVSTMVTFSIDEAILSNEGISKKVQSRLQDKLDSISSGIKIEGFQLTQSTWPRQVDDAFVASIKASQESERIVTQSRGYAENILNEAGGPVAQQIVDELLKPALDAQQTELLWDQLAGSAQQEIANAGAYRTSVVENAKASARYLQAILPEYVKRPTLVLQKIYQDTVETVLEGADEKIVVEPSNGKNRELRIQVNRDPKAKPKAAQTQTGN